MVVALSSALQRNNTRSNEQPEMLRNISHFFFPTELTAANTHTHYEDGVFISHDGFLMELKAPLIFISLSVTGSKYIYFNSSCNSFSSL